ncbi:zinc knuckle CX2CX4HX4C containing protein [Tanacetum coccineum]
MVDHSQKWHDGSSSRSVDSSSNFEGITAIVSKLDSLAHFDKECPLNEEVKSMKEVKYGEFSRPFLNNSQNNGRLNRGASGYDSYVQPSSGEKRLSFSDNERQETDKSRNDEDLVTLDASPEIKHVPHEEKQIVCYYVETYEPSISFPTRLEHHVEEALVNKTLESLKKIWINHPLLKEIRQTDNYAKHMKDLVVNKPNTKEDEKVRKLDFNNALAYLGASISVMPFSMYKRLGMGKLKPINMVIGMVDNTKCTPKGIVKNLLIKIDKFIFLVDFVILEMIEDFRMPIILGRPLLATAHAKVDIFRKSISLEVGNEKVIFKMRSSFTTTIFEFVRAIRSTGDDNLVNIDYDLFLYESESCEFNHLLAIDPDIFTYDIEVQESYEEFNGTSDDDDDDDVEWIIDYLEPTSNDGFIDLEDEAYKERMSKLLGMTYRKPASILIEKVEVTRYTVGPGKSYTKVRVLGIDKMPRTKDNLATLRARLMEEMDANGRVLTARNWNSRKNTSIGAGDAGFGHGRQAK